MYCEEMELLHSNLSVNGSRLFFAGYDTVELAKKHGTPLMLLDENRIRNRMRTYLGAMEKHFGKGSCPLYASKALSFVGIYQIAKEEGIKTDIVSLGELYTAKEAGFPLENAFFHGNSKTDFDIETAINEGIGHFVVDTYDELYAIDKIARANNKVQRVLLRITPGIDPHTHKAISTGSVDSKFGTAIETGQAMEIVKTALSLENIELSGLHCHIGSQIFEIEPFCQAADIMLEFINEIRVACGYTPKYLNLGGGFGVRYVESDPYIDYEENIKQIAEHINTQLEKYNLERPIILMEPGRSIVADSGMTIYQVGSVKEIDGYKNYVAVDGGMSDNPRYALYQSKYTVVCPNRMDQVADYECTVAGRLCESGDLIGEGIYLPKVCRGDYVGVLVTGAYNYSMASNYNRINRPKVLLLGEKERVAIERESYRDVFRLDKKLS